MIKLKKMTLYLVNALVCFPLCILLSSSLVYSSVIPKGTTDSPLGKTPFYIHGVVIAPPPCELNNGKPIEVDFGAILTTRIDGVRYRQPVIYNASCEGNLSSNLMTLTIKGNSVAFDAKYLKTSVEGLGIVFHINNLPFSINDKVNFTYPALPIIEATPIKSVSAILPGRDFSASATIEIAYQ